MLLVFQNSVFNFFSKKNLSFIGETNIIITILKISHIIAYMLCDARIQTFVDPAILWWPKSFQSNAYMELLHAWGLHSIQWRRLQAKGGLCRGALHIETSGESPPLQELHIHTAAQFTLQGGNMQDMTFRYPISVEYIENLCHMQVLMHSD